LVIPDLWFVVKKAVTAAGAPQSAIETGKLKKAGKHLIRENSCIRGK
jgi:hypothetical protein